MIANPEKYGTPCEACGKGTVLPPDASQSSTTCRYCAKPMRFDAEESLSTFVDGLTLQKCPKCKANVHKHDGCNHMTCHCGANFCYTCGVYMRNGGGAVTEHYMRGRCQQFPVAEMSPARREALADEMAIVRAVVEGMDDF